MKGRLMARGGTRAEHGVPAVSPEATQARIPAARARDDAATLPARADHG